MSFDPSTGDFVCTGTSHWTGTWTGSTTWRFTGNQSPTGAVSGRISEVFKGHVADGTAGTLTFAERITIDPDGKTDIRGSIVNSSGGLAHSLGHARWIGISKPDGSGSGTYVGQWHQGQPQCGDTITADTTLHHNLVNCPNNGILIGADNVTLDLNGHLIDGNGTPDASCNPVTDFCDFGVAFEGHDGITVKHGTVRQFEGGIGAFGTHHTRLLGISAPNNTFGDIGIANAARVLVRNCSGNRSTSPEGNGLGLFDSHHIRVLHSSFRHNVHVGIKPVGSTNTVIKGNLVARNGDEGLLMEGGERNRIRSNLFVRNGGGITLGPGSRNLITGNRVSGGHDGIRIEKGHGNLVAGNVVVHAHRAGIRLGIPHPFLGGANNVVRGNLVRQSRVDGFLVNERDDHSLLKGNTATGAGDDGLDVRSRTATLTRNRGLGNADLGIAAIRGVNDDGGNVARHNGDPRQCTHIVCH